MTPLQVSPIEGERGLRLAGELDLQTVALLNEALARLPNEGQARLDLSEVTFIDSTGLHAIDDFARGENGSGPLVLEGVSPLIEQVLTITKLTETGLLEIRTSRDGSG